MKINSNILSNPSSNYFILSKKLIEVNQFYILLSINTFCSFSCNSPELFLISPLFSTLKQIGLKYQVSTEAKSWLKHQNTLLCNDVINFSIISILTIIKYKFNKVHSNCTLSSNPVSIFYI